MLPNFIAFNITNPTLVFAVMWHFVTAKIDVLLLPVGEIYSVFGCRLMDLH